MGKHDICHSTQINATIDVVWAELTDLSCWKEWNKYTTLETTPPSPIPKTGDKGKLHACFEGDEKWKEFDMNFVEVNEETHALVWTGEVLGGFLFKGLHSMRLEVVSDEVTLLVHTEKFTGCLPALNFGLPYGKLKRNYLLINEALKTYVENKSKGDPAASPRSSV